jgi:hypothetical protein
MAKSTDTCNSLLALIFNATTWEGIAQDDTTGALTNLWIALYTDSPGVGGDPRTNEVGTGAYAGYVRKQVARTSAAWKVPAGGLTKNEAILQFVECSGGTGAHISHVAIVTTASGDGDVLYAGELTSHRDVSVGIQPQFAAEQLIITET